MQRQEGSELTIKDLLAKNAPAVLFPKVRRTRVTKPCKKARLGNCPIMLGDTIDCRMKPKIGCPFKGSDGKINMMNVRYWLSHREELAVWIHFGSYNGKGV